MNELGICEQDMYEQGMNEQEVRRAGNQRAGTAGKSIRRYGEKSISTLLF